MTQRTDSQNEDFCIKHLKVSFVKKDFVENFEANYEEYLTEFINSSKFVIDNGNKKFRIIKKQSHGECDITNDQYTIDYKLLMDNKTIENMNYHSESISVDKNGAVIYGASKKTGEFKIYIFLNILKNFSNNDIKEIESTERSNLTEFQKIVKDYINKIKKDKNMLYFIPYKLYFQDKKMDKEMLNCVVDKLNEGLKGFLEYRNAHIKNKDTYFSFISNENIVFLKYEKGLKLYDIVSLKESKLYLKIESISDCWLF